MAVMDMVAFANDCLFLPASICSAIVSLDGVFKLCIKIFLLLAVKSFAKKLKSAGSYTGSFKILPVNAI